MAVPTSREEFKDYCLRKLGYPILEINVTDEQVEDRIDETLSYYADYHFDGSFKDYVRWQVTDEDKARKWLTVPEEVLGVVRVFDIGDALSTNNLFNIRYQIALNDLYDLTSFNQALLTYYTNMQHIQFIEELLVGKQPIRYNRHMNKLHIDMDWDRIEDNYYILAEVYLKVDPGENPDVWKDRWLQLYATAKIKYQWGSNLIKFSGMQLPGNVTFNGDAILSEAKQEIEALEAEMISSYSPVLQDMIN